jgi:hypothetical protein
MSMEETAKWAACYQVCPRTIARWRKAGVDLANPESVADYLLGIRQPKAEALAAVHDYLTDSLP